MKRIRYEVSGIDCAACGNDIERRMYKLPSIYECRVNFITEKITVVLDDEILPPEELAQNLNKLSPNKLTLLKMSELNLTESEIDTLRQEKEQKNNKVDIKQLIFGKKRSSRR